MPGITHSFIKPLILWKILDLWFVRMTTPAEQDHQITSGPTKSLTANIKDVLIARGIRCRQGRLKDLPEKTKGKKSIKTATKGTGDYFLPLSLFKGGIP